LTVELRVGGSDLRLIAPTIGEVALVYLTPVVRRGGSRPVASMAVISADLHFEKDGQQAEKVRIAREGEGGQDKGLRHHWSRPGAISLSAHCVIDRSHRATRVRLGTAVSPLISLQPGFPAVPP